MLHITAHPGTTVTQTPDNAVEVSDYESMKEAIMGFVYSHEQIGFLSIYSYEGDIDADVRKACVEIKEVEPIGVFALEEILGRTTKIVSYYEIEIEIVFKRTKAQMDSIVTASTLRYLKSEMLYFMSNYASEAAIRTSVSGITPEIVSGYVRELYYQNPMSVIMLPGTVVEFFPPEGADRIIELTFGNWVAASILKSYKDSLTSAVARMVGQAMGENDMEIFRNLCEMLASACDYDEAGAVLVAEYGVQNFATTAYGALINGSAVGEGYAMAYKALCDELGLECTVVLGRLGDRLHAWNVVMLDGHYYHVDTAACDENGFEAGFLKSDEQFAEAGYAWDRLATKTCGGPFSEIQEEDVTENTGEESAAGIEGVEAEEESDGEAPSEDGEIDENSSAEDGAETTE